MGGSRGSACRGGLAAPPDPTRFSSRSATRSLCAFTAGLGPRAGLVGSVARAPAAGTPSTPSFLVGCPVVTGFGRRRSRSRGGFSLRRLSEGSSVPSEEVRGVRESRECLPRWPCRSARSNAFLVAQRDALTWLSHCTTGTSSWTVRSRRSGPLGRHSPDSLILGGFHGGRAVRVLRGLAARAGVRGERYVTDDSYRIEPAAIDSFNHVAERLN